ncbi:MAG: hypothetical protein WD895_02245 [Acidimicrobiia bacterium]
MLTDRAVGGAFEIFVKEIEPRLRDALSASLGSDRGREATADADELGDLLNAMRVDFPLDQADIQNLTSGLDI